MPASPNQIPSWLKTGASRARRVLSRQPGLAAAYLFGSALRSRHFRDVDVALLFASRSREPGPARMTELALGLDKSFKAETDLHLLSGLPEPVRFRVVRDGARFLTLDRLASSRFETDTLNLFLDFKPTFDRLAAGVLARPGPW